MSANTQNLCIVCGGTSHRQLYEGLLRCRACGYVFADARLTDEELRALYDEDFFTGAEFSDYAEDELHLRKNFRARLRVLRRFLDPSRHKRLLEIGSAYGFFLEEARALFESVEGIDITGAGIAHARERFQLDVTLGDFLSHDYGARRFDVVCMWDTIEHLREPQRFVEKIASLTERGALLALTTGDIESLNARLRGRRWRLIHPPTHLHYFSRRTIARLLAAHGFDVVYNRPCGFYRSLDNVAYNVFVLRHNLRLPHALLRRAGVARLGFYLNLSDIMYVIARRR
ncbi:MAG: class I SAM-dependent methyltransferase [Acidobacteria bacterium]|nr:class I SAM-dependent methyltransferase [Acidobacteriota bacterium]